MLASLFCTLLYSTVLYCLLLCAELVVVHGSPLVLSSPVAAFLAAACLVACLILQHVLCGGVLSSWCMARGFEIIDVSRVVELFSTTPPDFPATHQV